MYKRIFIKSSGDLKNNLILFLPDLLFGLLMTIIGGVIFYLSGLIPILESMYQNFTSLNQGDLGQKEQALIILMDLISMNFKRLLIAFASFMLTNFFIGAGFLCMKYGMMGDLIKNKKLKLREITKYSKRYYWKFILLRIYTSLFYLIPFLILILITTPLFFKRSIITSSLIGILFLFYFIYSVIAFLSFYFTIPILFTKDLKPWKVIKESYNYFKLKTKHVVLIGLIIALVFIFILIMTEILNMVFGMIAFALGIIALLSNVLKFIFNVWKSMFKFRAYK